MVARRFAALAVAGIALVVIAAVVPMRDEIRSALAIAALCAYGYFGGRAMQCWQGRGQPSLRRPAWRRRFLDDGAKGPARPVGKEPFEEDFVCSWGAPASR